MYATSSVLSTITSIGVDLGLLIAATVTVVITGWVALSGLGFAKRRFGKYISGKKF